MRLKAKCMIQHDDKIILADSVFEIDETSGKRLVELGSAVPTSEALFVIEEPREETEELLSKANQSSRSSRPMKLRG